MGTHMHNVVTMTSHITLNLYIYMCTVTSYYKFYSEFCSSAPVTGDNSGKFWKRDPGINEK